MLSFRLVRTLGSTESDADIAIQLTEDHIDRTQRIAHAVARGPVGRMAGPEELESEALVILWDLALNFDPDLNVPFTAYLSMNMGRRLIDWLRTTYGRASPGQDMPMKLLSSFRSVSIDDFYGLEGDTDHDYRLIDGQPGPEEIALNRDEWSRFCAETEGLSEHQRESLLWPVFEDTPTPYAERSGKSKMDISSTRGLVKARIARKLDRPLSKRQHNRTGGTKVIVSQCETMVVRLPRPSMRSKVSSLDGRRKHNHTLRTIPDEQLLADRKTMTLAQIAEKYGCTTSTVSKRLTKIGVARTRPRYAREIPWRVKPEHDNTVEMNRLRLLGRYRAGGQLSVEERNRLIGWLELCFQTGSVVDYDPETGFSYRSLGLTRREGHPYYVRALDRPALSA